MLKVKRLWCHLMHRKYWRLAIAMVAGYPVNCIVLCAKCDKSILGQRADPRVEMADWFEKAMK